MKNKLMAAVLASVLAFGCTAEHSGPAADGTAAEPVGKVAGLLSELEFSGTLLVARQGEVVLREAVNASPVEDAQAVFPDTRFAIASMTKSFTAALVLRLVDEGKLGLDQTLDELLPAFEAAYASEVSLRQLLQNRSGIPHYIDIPGWFDNDVKRAFMDDTFLEALETLELKFPPGSDYLYSNVNYYLLAMIVDRHAGVPYEEYLKSQILDQLGMSATGQIYQQDDNLAENYLRNDDGSYEIIPIVNPVLFRGTASMYSTVDDLRVWGKAVIDGKIYSDAAEQEVFRADTPMAWETGNMPVGDGQTVEALYYNGRLIGYLSLIVLLPEEDGVIVVLNNNTVGYDNMLVIASVLAGQYFGNGT